ncbi:hypothetical protein YASMINEVIRUS_764 [Yasminevirus sp. GU-2018]|uniref:Uncharacterized protein n=1 Tax=Yasminevirus sp. GU-2018 TaxID=2420051 RepID=A0A5K0U9P2_9VIRU|nr:hypothetical protein YASMINEVIRUS_764 [Yasminevirus sp. GU-2018]
MYITKVDDLIDRVIDDFYTVVMLKNKKMEKLKEELNFIKSQKDINEVVSNYIKTIPPSEISDIVKKGDSFNTIFETLQRYIMIYVFLTIGVFYRGKPDIFINNVVEFSRNQSEYSLKINNFFNAESNSQIIKLYYICKNVVTLLSKDAIKIDYIKREPYATDTMEFLGSLNDEFITAAFRLKSLNGDTSSQAHNIIKTLLILLVYKITDKKLLYSMIEQSELSEGEYMFIDIVEPVTDTINFNTIESLLSKKDLFNGLAYEIWDYINEIDTKSKKIVTNEEKINILINSGIIVPIMDDFLLYHRDNERYDKMTTTGTVKKKEDTKVRYIIGKIDTTTELYSESTKKDPKLRANIMKNFSVPLYNKKAILRNNNEEVKIINKFINQGKRNAENNDYFNDLIGYRRYAYVNFKEFDKFGFSNHFTKTVTAVRAVNFDTTSEFKQTNTNQKLQMRVGAKDTIGNIVGFMIPTNTKSIKCVKISDTVNIRDLSKKNKNGFDLFLSFLKRSIIKGEEHKASVYWMFDPNLDKVKIDRIEGKDNTTQQDIVKAMVSELYNKVVEEIYFEMIDRIDVHSTITIDNAMKIIHFLEKSVLNIPLSQDMYEDIERYIFEKKMIDLKDGEILDNDTLFGLEGDTIRLPQYIPDNSNRVRKITIDLAHVDESGQIIEQESVGGICQHNITWENINKVRKTDYSEYMRLLYDFIQQYVVENVQQDYICKSCGYYLDIKKFIQDGVFDDEKGFITFSMPMETNLEDLPEYEKFQFSIKIMDKNIEKIASSVGIPYFIGNATTIKWRRKAIIKNTIDMVAGNNQMLIKNFKERNENKTKLYGISKALSNLFVFDMENNIFQSSSKDKDQEQFKMIKRNNIITYIMIYMLLELNESQISFFTTDKKNMCDIRIFDKVYTSLFSGLRLKKNNTNDTVDITKYKILCYLIYMISCRIAKHRLWASPQATEKNIQKMIPNTQRFIVHTCVDIINSILENSFHPGMSYIFEVFRVRFYSKLASIFKDNDYYNILLTQNKNAFLTAKKRAHLKLVAPDADIPFTYNPIQWRTEIPARFFPPYLKRVEFNLHGITNLSNCPDGQFHKWKLDNGAMTCTLCKVKMQDLKYSEQESEKIIEKFKIERTNLLAQKFCQVDGELHQYVYDPVSGQNLCLKCKRADDHRYTVEELEKIDKVIDRINEIRRERYHTTVEEYRLLDSSERQYITDVVGKNRENMMSEIDRENPFKFIDTFVDMLQSSIGNEIKGEYPINLRNNTYIIDHDHNGHDLGGKEIIITESDNKIFHKANHPHFKTDVIFYTDKTGSRIDVFYDMITRKLLGYKEASRDYVDIKKTDKKIKINYSIYNKLKLLGYTSEYINIDDDFKEVKKQYEMQMGAVPESDTTASNETNQQMYREIVKDISRTRIENLKKTLLEFQRIFNRILNGYTDVKERHVESENKPPERPGYEKEITNYFSDKMNSLVDKYRKKLKSVHVKDDNNKHRVFKHWKGITRGVYVENFDDKYFNFESDLVEADNISRYDAQSNMILYYLVREFSTLVKYNQEGFMRTNVCNFLVEFIDRIFFRYNTEHLHVNNDIKRFMYILSSTGYLRETEEQIKAETPQGFYEEYVDADEEPTEEDLERQIDDEEEQEALDVDMDAGDMEEGVPSGYDRQAEIDMEFEEMGVY